MVAGVQTQPAVLVVRGRIVSGGKIRMVARSEASGYGPRMAQQPRAKTLEEATKLLDPRPLDFSDPSPQGAKVAANPAFYAEPPKEQDDDKKLPGPMDKLRRKLLGGTRETKVFLSGHVGSGKSTELSRLATHREIRERFSVVMLRFEEHEWSALDVPQILFRIAAALYEAHKRRLPKDGGWQKKLEVLNDRIFIPMGVRATDGSVALEFDLVIFKLRQDLKFSERARSQFREYGENERTLLPDFISALVDDIEDSLSKEPNEPGEVLVIVDDLDKVRGEEQQAHIFDANLSTLLGLPMRVVYTLPTGVRFVKSRADLRQNVQHLFPMRVLRRAPDTFDPEAAWDDERFGFFEALVAQRTDPGLIDRDAIQLAAIYSGGVLREFFRLLREGTLLATFNDLKVLDRAMLHYAIKDARLNESIGLYETDYEALAHVHHTNRLPTEADRRYLDLSLVIECHNGEPWFEANPLLWSVLDGYVKRRDAEPEPQP